MSKALSAALAATDQAAAAVRRDDTPLVVAKVRGLMIGYDRRWSGDGFKLEGEPEKVVSLPIVNPATGRISRTFTQKGKYDGVVRQLSTERKFLLEHKSTSEDLADPASAYFERLQIDGQVSRYMLQSWQEGLKLDGALYDVIRKPGIRPRKLTAAERKEIDHLGTWEGWKLDEDDCVEAMDCERETPRLYELRVARQAIDEPERYFARRSLLRMDSEVVEYAGELWQISDEIRRARKSERHFRNPDACVQYGRKCEYLPLCSGNDTEDSDRWERRAEVHAELPAATTPEEYARTAGGRDVITHSRVNCFQSCRRKHFYRYEMGLRRRHDEEEGEALYLGTVLHAALAEWWRWH